MEVRAGPFKFFQAKPSGEMSARPETEPWIDLQVDPLAVRGFFPDRDRPQAAADVLDVKMVPPEGRPLLLVAGHGLDRGQGEGPGQFPAVDFGFREGIEVDFDHGLVAVGLLEGDRFHPPVFPNPIAKRIRIFLGNNEFQLTARFHGSRLYPLPPR